MRAQQRLKQLDRAIEKVTDKYVKGAPFHVLEAIVEGDIWPTWQQVIEGDYEIQDAIRETRAGNRSGAADIQDPALHG